MTDHQLSYCSVCTKKHFDKEQGILCSLTGQKPDFTGVCPTFDPAAGADLSTLGKARALPLTPVGLGKRFANMMIDTLVALMFAFFSLVVVAIYLSAIAPNSVRSIFVDEYGETSTWIYVFAFAIYVFYYTIMEMSFGRTIGKLITGTIVVDANENRPTVGIACKRSLIRLVPFEMFSFLGDDPRGWHDRWTGTFVVEKDSLVEDIFKKRP